MSDEAVFEHLKGTAQHLDHEFREANKRALLNVVSGEGQGRAFACAVHARLCVRRLKRAKPCAGQGGAG